MATQTPGDFVGIGIVEIRDPGAHAADPRGVIRGQANGLSKREYFAGLAMQSLISGMPIDRDYIAAEAILMADALLKLLNGK